MMITTFVSDLHLGDGGPLEDFLLWGTNPEGPPTPPARQEARAALGRQFGLFLAAQRAEAERAGLQPHLVLAGDTFDLWQARRDREPNRPAMERILAAHPLWLDALRDWTASGAMLTILLGNHDHALVDPPAWDVLRRALPAINPTADGAPLHALADEHAGWYAEHGNQWDPINRLRSLTNPRATCAGYRIVRAVVNNLEPLIPTLESHLRNPCARSLAVYSHRSRNFSSRICRGYGRFKALFGQEDGFFLPRLHGDRVIGKNNIGKVKKRLGSAA